MFHLFSQNLNYEYTCIDGYFSVVRYNINNQGAMSEAEILGIFYLYLNTADKNHIHDIHLTPHVPILHSCCLLAPSSRVTGASSFLFCHSTHHVLPTLTLALSQMLDTLSSILFLFILAGNTTRIWSAASTDAGTTT